MRTLLLLLFTTLLLPTMAHAQEKWTFESVFADSTNSIRGTQGIAVDPDGKVWLQSYFASETFDFGGPVLLANPDRSNAEEEVTSALLNVIYVYNADGTPASFSPLGVLSRNGTVVDTLGVEYVGKSPDGKNKLAAKRGRGLRASPEDGNIYVSQNDILYRINYKTGELMSKTVPYPGVSLAAVAVDALGSVYTAPVVPTQETPVRKYSADLQAIDATLITGIAGVSRTLEVSPDGNTVFWPAFTKHSVALYQRADEFEPFPAVPDTVLKGISAESVVLHPVTGNLWLSAGSPGNRPNQFIGFPSNYNILTWYEFDWTQLSTANTNPAPLDSIVWEGGGDARPRAIDFSADGKTAYLGDFNLPVPSVQKFVQTVVSAAEPLGEVPTGVALSGNAPNPFAGITTITFALPTPGHATLKVYDTLGREVATLVDGMLAADTYRAQFDASGLSSGLYVYRLHANGESRTGTMTVLR